MPENEKIERSSGEEPDELKRYRDQCRVREDEDLSDGRLLSDNPYAFGLIDRDATYIGDGGEYTMDLDPTPVDYDRAEWVDINSERTKLWVFTDADGNQIAVKWEYIERVRDVFGLSLDDIRRYAKRAGQMSGHEFPVRPILIDSPEHEYRAVIMPHRSLSDE